jgi:hypothetical protein
MCFSDCQKPAQSKITPGRKVEKETVRVSLVEKPEGIF